MQGYFLIHITHVVILCAKHLMYSDHYLQRTTVLEDDHQEL